MTESLEKPITKYVVCKPRATAFDVTLDVVYEDIKHRLNLLWNDEPQGIRTIGPKPKSREEWERQYFGQLYESFCVELVLDGVQKQQSKRICFLNVVKAEVRDETVRIHAVVWFEPEVNWVEPESMDRLIKTFTSKEPIGDDVLESNISRLRHEMQFNERNVKTFTDGEPIKPGDLLQCLVAIKGKDGAMQPPTTKVIGMDEKKCPKLLYDACLGKKLGETVEFGVPADDPILVHGVWRVDLKQKLSAPEITDDQLCLAQGVPSIESLKMNLSRKIEKQREDFFDERLLQAVFSSVTYGPLCSEMLYDRAEGLYNKLLEEHKEPELLKTLGASVRSEGIKSLVPKFLHEYVISRVAQDVCRHLGCYPTEEDLAIHAKRVSTGLSAETRYPVELDLCQQRMITYFKTKGEAWEKSLLVY